MQNDKDTSSTPTTERAIGRFARHHLNRRIKVIRWNEMAYDM